MNSSTLKKNSTILVSGCTFQKMAPTAIPVDRVHPYGKAIRGEDG
jgi:hypothetical protein